MRSLCTHTCEGDAGVSAADAGVDAANPDGDASTTGVHFDVAYASEISLGPSTPFGLIGEEVVIINTGTEPLQMGTMTVEVALASRTRPPLHSTSRSCYTISYSSSDQAMRTAISMPRS